MFYLFISVFISSCLLNAEAHENLQLDIISYEKLVEKDTQAMQLLDKALHEKGIVGVRGVPGFKEKYEKYIEAAKAFSSLAEEIKENYKPNRDLGETFLGYESGKEKFKRKDGAWVIDDLKTSFYAYIPDNPQNKWPSEVNLQDPFIDLGQLMAETGEMIMYKMGLLGSSTFELEENALVGRMLYYRKSKNHQNPYWCGAHFDHGLFTALLPAVYFVGGERVLEPEEAGLFIRPSQEKYFKKVSVDEDVMLFQVGEFGQLALNDGIQATEHCVKKAFGAIERYTLAVFYCAPMDLPIYSRSILTDDERYSVGPEEAFTYRQWEEASLLRYLVKEDEE